jgi:hypothetical protein
MTLFNRRAVLVCSATGTVLLLFLVGIWILRFEYQARAPVALAARTVRGSAKMRRVLGEPMHVSRLTRGTLISYRGDGNADLIIRIRGPLGRGTVYEWAQQGVGKWHICSLLFKSSDGSTDILPVDDFYTHCDRE